jgi:predicted nucleic-acid-binding protein
MIAIDTNVLVRYLIGDDAAQAASARVLIEEVLSDEEPGFISLVVLCELAWAMSYSYRKSRVDIARTIGALTEVRQFQLEAPEIVIRALAAGNTDVADAVIHEVGKANRCAKTVTFDKRFARQSGVELLAH